MDFEQRTKLNAEVGSFVEKRLHLSTPVVKNEIELFKSLKSISDFITKNLNSSFYMGPQLKLLISIGSAAILGDKDVQQVATSCIFFIERRVFKARAKDLEHIILICADQILFRTHLDRLEVIPKNAVSKIRDHLNMITPIQVQPNLSLNRDINNNLMVLMQNPSISISLKKSLSIVLSGASKEGIDGETARKALAYLLQEEDFLDDRLGIFGLADDIFVIEEAALLLGGLTFGEAFLIELVTNGEGSESLYFETDQQLHPLGPQTQLILKSLRHVSKNDEHKTLIILPQIGPTAILYLLDRCTSEASQDISFEKMPSIGDEVYFRVINGYVAGTFSGYREVGDSKIPMLQFVDDPNASQVSVTENILINSIKHTPANARIFRNQKSYDQKRKQDAPFIPRHIQLIPKQSETYIIYTQKKHFDKVFQELKPFGSNLSSLFHVNYVNANGDFKSTGTGPIELLVCSDESVAGELIKKNLKDDVKLNLIIEFASNCSGLISSLTDGYLSQIHKITCLASTSDFAVINELEDRGFQFIYLKDIFSELGINHSGSINPIRKYERFLSESTKKHELKSNDLMLPSIDIFHDNFKHLFSEIYETSGELKYLLFTFREKLIWNPLPFSQIDLAKLVEQRNFICDQLELYSFDSIYLFVDLITKKWDQLITEINSRDLVEAIEQEASDKVAVFARTAVEVERIEAFLLLNNLPDIDVITLETTEIKETIEVLIVPVMPSRRMRSQLSQTKLAKQVILNFTISEATMFLQAKQRSENIEKSFMIKGQQAFKSFESYSRKLRSVRSQVQKVDVEVDPVDLDELELQRIKRDLDSTETNHSGFQAVPLLLSDRTEYVLIPENAQVIKLNRELNLFNFENQKFVKEGDFILLRNSIEPDYLSDFAAKVFPDFTQESYIATIWKKKLRDFCKEREFSAASLARQLSEKTSLKRTPVTIQNWLAQGDTVAPADYLIDLRYLNNFLRDYGYSFDYDLVTGSIEKVYKYRRESRELIMNYLTNKDFAEIRQETEITIQISDFKFVLIVKEVSGRASSIETSYSKVWNIRSLVS